MSGFADTLLSKTFLASDIATLIESAAIIYAGTSGGSANTQTLTPASTLTSYATGQRLIFIAGYSNTGALTLNVSSLGAKAVVMGDGSTACSGGEVSAGRIYIVQYDGTSFRLCGPDGATWSTWTPTLSASGSMTFTSTSIGRARYVVVGKICTIQLIFNGTTGGTASNYIRFTPPFTAASTVQSIPAFCNNGSGDVSGMSAFLSTTLVGVYLSGGGNWGLGSGRYCTVSGSYEIA